MIKELKCPKCGSTAIEEEDCYDTITCFNAIKELYCGHCQECGIDLQWATVYTFSGYDEIEED